MMQSSEDELLSQRRKISNTSTFMLPRFFTTLRSVLNDKYRYLFLKKCKRAPKNLKNMLRNIFFTLKYLQIHQKPVPLHCVFHSIRFKVNKGWSKALLLFFCPYPTCRDLLPLTNPSNLKNMLRNIFFTLKYLQIR